MKATTQAEGGPWQAWLDERGPALAVTSLVAGVGLAYSNTLNAPFVFDDIPAIVENPAIRHLNHLGVLLWPSADGSAVAGRPLVNLSFAINYAIGGLNPVGYHLANLLIHAAAAVLLFGIFRWTFTFCRLPRPVLFGWCGALLWAIHPLLTESVTCCVQRTESLMGFFYLLTLFSFIRGRWVLSVAACALGMATKEVMVTAPLVVLLYDRAFMSGSLKAAWLARQRYYLGLGATWLVLVVLVGASGFRRGSAAGFGLGVSWGPYLLTQAQALWTYLRLSVWPSPLIVDYGDGVIRNPLTVAIPLVVLGTLLVASVVGFFQRPRERGFDARWALGFIGCAFFLILAPSSAVPLVTQTIAEHRMYLSLAVLVGGGVALLARYAGPMALPVALCGAGVLGFLTFTRNQVYGSGVSLWEDTVGKRPDNPRAWNNLGLEKAAGANGAAEAIACYKHALALRPTYAEAHDNLALTFDLLGRYPEAEAHYREALSVRPVYPEAIEGLAVTLGHEGKASEAGDLFRRALALRPDRAEGHFNYGIFLSQFPDRQGESVAQYEEALRCRPEYPEAQFNLANTLAEDTTARSEAIAHYQEAIHLKPDYVEAYNNLAILYANLGRLALAEQEETLALRMRPDFIDARENLRRIRAADSSTPTSP